MDKNNLQFVLYLEVLLGASNITGNSKTKIYHKVYNLILLFIVTLFHVHCIFIFCTSEERTTYACVLFVNRLFASIVIIYVLKWGYNLSERKEACVLSLNAIESYLSSLYVQVPSRLTETIITFLSVFILLLHLIGLIFRLFSHPLTCIHIFEIAFLIYGQTLKCSQVFACLSFLVKCFRIQKALRNEIEYTQLQFFENRLQSDCEVFTTQRRVAWAEGSEIQRRHYTYLKTILTTFDTTEREVNSLYCMFSSFLAINTAVCMPLVVITTFEEMSYNAIIIRLGMICNGMIIVLVVLISSLCEQEKVLIKDKLPIVWANSRELEARSNVKHCMLQYLHTSTPHSCYIFDVDASLLATILETTLLIVTTALNY